MKTQIYVRISDQESDLEWLESATAKLSAELLELDVDDVVPARGMPPPPGARAVDVTDIGSLLVTVTPELRQLSQVVATVRGWLVKDQRERTVELVIGDDKLTVTGISEDAQDRLVDAWLRAHALDQGTED